MVDIWLVDYGQCAHLDLYAIYVDSAIIMTGSINNAIAHSAIRHQEAWTIQKYIHKFTACRASSLPC